MRKQENILKKIDFDGFIVDVNSKNFPNKKHQFVKNEIQGKIDIESIYFSGDYASIYFKSISNYDEDNLKEICRIHKSVWNQRKVPFLYVSTPTELRIYNCFKEPIDPNKNLGKIDEIEIVRYTTSDTEKHLKKLVSLFGRVAIDSGEYWANNELTNKFKVSKRVDSILVQNLKATKTELEKRQIPTQIIHDLLTRSLFILYLEDIGATNQDANKFNKSYYHKFKKGATSYFHVLSNFDATYKLYKELEDKFNGDIFLVSKIELQIITDSDLELISSCFWGNSVNSGQQSLWKMFDFSVIPIELLSEIYEIFLNKTDREKSKNGEYYTPHSLVDLILNESLPWADSKNKNYDLKILDIACGSGIFLVESYRRLVDRWIYSEDKQPEFKDLEKILVSSIYGFEINQEAIKVAAFSLYLALISYLDPKTIWQKKSTRFPYLIFEPDRKDKTKQGQNLFRLSSLSNVIKDQPEFDLVVGNPPFKSAKTGKIESEASAYCKKYGFAQEMVLPFLHRSNQFCNTTGKVSIISTSKILFNKSGGYKTFRQFLFNDNYVEAVFNFSALRRAKKGQGKSVFANAVGPSCVLFFKKNPPKKQKNNLTYVCPKPTVRDQFSDDIILDPLDFYYLPRHECTKPDTVIWKTAMWGTENDFQLIKHLTEKKSLKNSLTKKNGWFNAKGFQFQSKQTDTIKYEIEIDHLKTIEAKNLNRYYTAPELLSIHSETLTNNNKKFYINTSKITNYRRLGNKRTYYAPHVLIKEGQTNKKFCATYLNYDCSFKSTITGIAFNKNGIKQEEFNSKNNLLKSIVAFLNSKLSAYFLFLTSISWGVERERVTSKDLLELPALPFEMANEQVIELAKKVDDISTELYKDFRNEEIIALIETEIDEIIYKALNLTKREQYLIEDVLDYSLDLFQEGENSLAYAPIRKNNKELKDYLKILCEDINDHFQFSDTTVWASLWEMPVKNPMQLVAIHFSDEYKVGHIKTFSNSSELDSLIHKIDKYSYKKHSSSVYFRKVVKYYEGDVIYIIKPNQKRFWSRAQAMQDSSAILLEIANMNEV